MVRAQGRPISDFARQNIVVSSAGSPRIGVLNAARKAMARLLGGTESALENARKVEELGSQGLAEGSKLTEVNTGSWRSWSRGYWFSHWKVRLVHFCCRHKSSKGASCDD